MSRGRGRPPIATPIEAPPPRPSYHFGVIEGGAAGRDDPYSERRSQAHGAAGGEGLVVALPDPPDIVASNPDALEEWHRAGGELVAARMMTPLFSAAFTGYCMTWAIYVRVERDLAALTESAEFAYLIVAPSGYPQLSPIAAYRGRLVKTLADLAAEFGMTPSSLRRARESAEGLQGELDLDNPPAAARGARAG